MFAGCRPSDWRSTSAKRIAEKPHGDQEELGAVGERPADLRPEEPEEGVVKQGRRVAERPPPHRQAGDAVKRRRGEEVEETHPAEAAVDQAEGQGQDGQGEREIPGRPRRPV